MIHRPILVEQTIHVAIVQDAGGVLFVATGVDRANVSAALVAYLDERCLETLWPADANEVRDLVRAQMYVAAIETYFASVGQRWDPELLSITSVPFHGAPDQRSERAVGVSL